MGDDNAAALWNKELTYVIVDLKENISLISSRGCSL